MISEWDLIASCQAGLFSDTHKGHISNLLLLLFIPVEIDLFCDNSLNNCSLSSEK